MHRRLLLDTCGLIWLATGHDQLSSETRRSIELAQTVAVSAISAWEIGLKAARGTLSLPLSAKAWFERSLDVHHLELASLSLDVLMMANELPWHHRDPADRFIIATAKLNDLAVVTGDRRFVDYGVSILS